MPCHFFFGRPKQGIPQKSLWLITVEKETYKNVYSFQRHRWIYSFKFLAGALFAFIYMPGPQDAFTAEKYENFDFMSDNLL